MEDRYLDFWVDHACRVIKQQYGDIVVIKHKDLLKFGRNKAVGTSSTTIMTLAGTEINETYISANLIDTLSSSSGSDTMPIVVEGHTIDGNGDFTFVVQTATLNGQNKVVLTTPLARCTRLYNNGATNLVGAVYAYQEQSISAGVPQTANKVHCIIRAGKNQSEKAATCLSKDDYWIITKYTATVLEKTQVYADVELEVRLKGKVFRVVDITGCSSGVDSTEEQLPFLIVPPNSDVRLRAVSSTADTDVAGSIHGFLAIKQSASS